MSNLELIWGLFVAFCIMMYIILDGFTLGTGMIIPWLSREDRDIAISVILPTWDGNQTWLVLGLAMLYGAFPLAFGLLCPVLYLPLLFMGIALLFRGIVFEFRLKSKSGVARWDIVFSAASLLITLIQGLVLGAFVQGFDYNPNANLLHSHGLITPFTCFTAISLLIGYTLLGATRLILKTHGNLQQRLYPVGFLFAFLIMTCIVIASLWTPFIDPAATRRWFGSNLWPYISALPLATGIAFIGLLYGLHKQKDHVPYWSAVTMFLCTYLGFGISTYPYIIPYHLKFWQAAAPDSTLRFILVGAVIMVPFLLIYTFYSYRIFRGKVKESFEY